MADSGEKHAAAVYNPVKIDVDELRKHVDAAAHTAGWGETRYLETSLDDPGREATRRAVDDGASMVIVAGGDGTVRSVGHGLRGTGIPLGLVPSGTGNLLARNLSLPLGNIELAADIAFNGPIRPIDLGIAELRSPDGKTAEHAFLVMAGMGIDAQMIANTNDDLKKAVGWLAYVDAGMRSLSQAKPFHIRYQLEDRNPHGAHVSTILVANCGTLQGGLELLPDALIDDGQLDIAVLQPNGMLGWLQVWRKVRWENSILRRSSIGRRIIKATSGNDSTVTYLRSATVVVRPDEPQPVELDGDEFGDAAAVRFTTDAGALRVRVQ